MEPCKYAHHSTAHAAISCSLNKKSQFLAFGGVRETNSLAESIQCSRDGGNKDVHAVHRLPRFSGPPFWAWHPGHRFIEMKAVCGKHENNEIMIQHDLLMKSLSSRGMTRYVCVCWTQ